MVSGIVFYCAVSKGQSALPTGGSRWNPALPGRGSGGNPALPGRQQVEPGTAGG